ncbi:MAG: hypothetical protein R3Y11_01575 [Pseudomonadota bacterium]
MATEVDKTNRAAMIDAMLEQSQGTDIPVLLKAKEAAKKAVSEDASNVNLAALQRATKMLEGAQRMTQNTETTLKDVQDVLLYLKEQGRKIGQAKLYKDINRGLLRRDQSLGFKKNDVDKYATTLPMSETPAHVNRKVMSLQTRKDAADVRIKEAEARRKELLADTAEGKLIPRDLVDQELAARAVTFNAALKTQFEAQSLECIQSVGGDQQLAHHFLRLVESIIDDCSNRYAQPLEIEVQLAEGPDLSSVDFDTE